MKTLKELKDVKKLSKTEQKAIAGGILHCDATHLCPPSYTCIYSTCKLVLEP